MTADEMLFELGYTNCIGSDIDINYNNFKENTHIIFWMKEREVEFFHGNRDGSWYSQEIDMPLLKAINQKCKELGWIE